MTMRLRFVSMMLIGGLAALSQQTEEQTISIGAGGQTSQQAPAPESEAVSQTPAEHHFSLQLPEEEREKLHFAEVMSDRTASPIDYARGLEEHLQLFPNTTRRPAIERALVQQAMETRDDRRLIEYGSSLLAREPDRLDVMERVIRALLGRDDEESSKKAFALARQFESSVRVIGLSQPPAGQARVKMRIQLDTSMGKALVYQARSTGNLGNVEDAVELAKRSYEVNPSAEAAREVGRWLMKAGKDEEAIHYIADAFVMDDPMNSATLRSGDRGRLKDLYTETHGSEAGLGDIILAAYDRTSELLNSRREELKKLDPNLDVQRPLDFTLGGLNGEKLELSTLTGKVIVLDFWATWCRPCQVQQPLYEEVKAKYKDNKDLVFLNINTDEDREIVGKFIKNNGWDKTVYFEDGLQRILQVSSIPTTIILDRHGDVASHMRGFHPEEFVETLSKRIDRTLRAE